MNKKELKDKILKISLEINEKIKELKKLKYEFIKLEDEYDGIWYERFMYYKNDFPVKLSSNEIKDLLERDIELKNLKKQIKKLQVEIDIIEKEIKNLDSLRWDIKNFIEWEKLTSGII